MSQDRKSATRLAQASNARVEVLDERTEYTQMFAEPDGRLTYEAAVTPQRVHRPDGSWADVDLSLEQAPDGSLRPRASVADVRFSADGSGPLVTMVQDGKTFTLSWPGGGLRAPRLDADTATYPEVLPGVDLVVRPTDLGFSHVLAIKTAAAAENSELRNITLDLGGDARVSRGLDGSLRAVAGSTLVASAPAPAMWDSRAAEALTKTSQRSAAALQGAADDSSTAIGPGDAARVAPVATEVTASGDLILRPDQAMLDGAATFPVFIDPDWGKSKTRWAYSTNNNTNNSDVSRARVGKDPDGRIYRSYFEFPTSTLKGKHVESAKVRMEVDHSWSCVDTPTHLFSANPIASTPRTAWKSSSPFLRHLGSLGSHANEGTGCSDSPQPDMLLTFVDGAIGAVVANAATKGSSTVTMALSAGNSSQDHESAGERWKKFFPNAAKLIAIVDAKPAKPVKLQVSGAECLPSGSIGVGVTNPSFSAYMHDDDEDQDLKSTWDWYKVGDDWEEMADPPVSGTSAQSRDSSARVSGAVNKQLYAFRVQTQDPWPYEVLSPWSDWCYFRIDTDDPPVSGVVVKVPEGAGKDGKVKISSPDPGVTTFRYGWSAAVKAVAAKTVPGEPGKSVEVTVTAPKYGDNILYLQAEDSTQNVGDGSLSVPVAAGPEPSIARWGLERYPGRATAAEALADRQTADASDTPLSAATTEWTDKRRLVGGRNITFPGSDPLTTASSVLDTTKNFSVAAWVRIDEAAGFQNIVSQDGDHVANFQLQYRGDDRTGDGQPDKSFCFGMRTEDKDAAASMPFVCGVNSAALGRWTHVAGGFDAAEQKLRIWVDGVMKQEADAPPAWRATGVLRIGNRKYSSTAWTDNLVGSVADVQVFDRSVVREDFTGKDYGPGASIADEPGILTPIEVGGWDFNTASGCYDPTIPDPVACRAPDGTSWGRQLRLTQGTEISQGSDNFATFDNQQLSWLEPSDPLYGTTTHEYGVSQENTGTAAQPIWQDRPVLYTDQSFTISASVRMDSVNAPMTAIAQKGNKQSAFYLGPRTSTVDSVTAQRFEVMIPSLDQDLGETYDHVIASTPPLDVDDTAGWTDLTMVYDAGARKVTLYVNGKREAEKTVNALWNASGPLIVGSSWWAADNTSGRWAANWFGSIDNVHVYQGAMTAAQVAKLIDEQNAL